MAGKPLRTMDKMQPASLDGEIAAAKERVAELKRLKEAQQGPWPKRCNIYIDGSKESNYEAGRELGLSEEALDQFIYTAYEVRLEFEVNQDGSSFLLGVDGKELTGKPLPPRG